MGIDLDKNERLFETVFQRHQKAVLAYFIGHGLAREDAKDLVQETFSRVWARIEGLCGWSLDRQRSWIFRIAANQLIDFTRRRQHRRSVAISEEEAYGSDTVHTQVELRDASQALATAILGLPPERRLILSLTVLGEMTSDEIGTHLGQPAGTVRYELNQARTALKKKMEEWTETN